MLEQPTTQPPDRGGRFTYAEYREMIRRLRDHGYRFADFLQAADLVEQGVPFAVLRHDLDLSVQRAVPMARLEAELGVSATYFVMLRNEYYNLLAAADSAALEQILACGHQLGLHFNIAAYPGLRESTDGDLLRRYVAREARIVEDWFGARIEVVSFHRPSQAIFNAGPELIAPRLHTYLPLFTRAVQYISDSLGRWRFGHPLASEAFQSARPLHILTHPFWWHDETLSQEEAISRFVQEQAQTIAHAIEVDLYPAL